jgi:hypothetical protein
MITPFTHGLKSVGHLKNKEDESESEKCPSPSQKMMRNSIFSPPRFRKISKITTLPTLAGNLVTKVK